MLNEHIKHELQHCLNVASSITIVKCRFNVEKTRSLSVEFMSTNVAIQHLFIV